MSEVVEEVQELTRPNFRKRLYVALNCPASCVELTASRRAFALPFGKRRANYSMRNEPLKPAWIPTAPCSFAR